MKLYRYGKSSTALLEQKTSFFEENELHLKNQHRLAKVYRAQAKRVQCKNCDCALNEEEDFCKDTIGYKICQNCQHLNGTYEDSDDFCKAVYTGDEGKSYSKNYQSSDCDAYKKRTRDIYDPKVNFLIEALENNGQSAKNLSYFDFGSGSGYFVSALLQQGLKSTTGSDVSKNQVDFGNSMIQQKVLSIHEQDKTLETLSLCQSQVISLIGVLEHLQNPRAALKAISANPKIEYIYLSVPTFSLSTFIETFSENIFHRQLHGGHTHLYTPESLKYLQKEFHFTSIGEWWFGSDLVDLYRHMSVHFENLKTSAIFKAKWKKDFLSVLDLMQIELDKKQLSSEVHMLLKCQ